MQISLMELDAV